MNMTIGEAARTTGVPEHTLRAWERRYRLFTPVRGSSGYRLYDDAALAAIKAMQALVAAGWAPSAAADELSRRPQAVPSLAAAAGSVSDPFAALVQAAAEFDAAAISRIIDEQFALAEYESVIDGWLMPALVRLGKEWAAGRLTIAEEHLVSNIVLRRLSAAYDAAGRLQPGSPILVGSVSGVEHELGLMAFAVSARRAGLATVYLGTQVPPADWRRAAVKAGSLHSVTSAHRKRDAQLAIALAETLGQTNTVWVGGSAQQHTSPACRPLGHSIAAAAQALAAELAPDRRAS